MDVKFKLIDNILYVMLIGELDEYTASYARNILDESIYKYTFGSVVFELSKLDFMDSTGIGVLIGRYKTLSKKNKKTYISKPSKSIEKIFNMSGLFEIMPRIS